MFLQASSLASAGAVATHTRRTSRKSIGRVRVKRSRERLLFGEPGKRTMTRTSIARNQIFNAEEFGVVAAAIRTTTALVGGWSALNSTAQVETS
jgi:hypothetical protein